MAAEARAEGKRPLGIRRRLRRVLKRARRELVGLSAEALLRLLGLLSFEWNLRVFPLLTRFLAPPLLRRKVRTNLARAFGEDYAAKNCGGFTAALSSNLGLLLAESLAAWKGRLPEGYLEDRDVAPVLRALLAEGRGVVAVTGHVGNWELLGRHIHRLSIDRPVAVIVKRLSNPRLDRIVTGMRRETGIRIFYQDVSLRHPLTLLRAGGLLGLVPDQDIKRANGIFLPFFGKDAFTPTGPAALAVASGAPLVTGFTRRTGGGLAFEVYGIHRPRPGADRHEEIERLTRAWSLDVERRIRAVPEDWVWFHDRWRTTPERLAARMARRRA